MTNTCYECGAEVPAKDVAEFEEALRRFAARAPDPGAPGLRALPLPAHGAGGRPARAGPGARPRRQQRPQPSAVRGTDRAVARRRSAAGILVGAALAGLVWVFALVGGDYEAASAPEPVATSVVHVRGGETLNSVAARVAPEVPRQAVINQLRALNGMTTTALSVGQALVVPVYR